MSVLFLVSVVTFLVLGCATAVALPRCAGPVKLANAHVARVDEKTRVLDLTSGQKVHLEGIRLPAGAADRAPVGFARAAIDAITTMVRSDAMTLTTTPPELDRYRRLRAQAFVGEHWLQADLLERGLARVSLAPD